MRAVDILRKKNLSKHDLIKAKTLTEKRIRNLRRHKEKKNWTNRKQTLLMLLERRVHQIDKEIK